MSEIPQDLVMQSTKEMTTMWLLFMKDEKNRKKGQNPIRYCE